MVYQLGWSAAMSMKYSNSRTSRKLKRGNSDPAMRSYVVWSNQMRGSFSPQLRSTQRALLIPVQLQMAGQNSELLEPA